MNKLIKDQIIWIIIGTGFICSLSYNYGYFYEYIDGIKLLSIHDILNSFSLWLPAILAPFIFGYGINTILKRTEDGLTEKEIIEQSKYPRITRAIRSSSENLIYLIVVLVLPASYLLLGYPYDPLLLWLAFFVFWAWLSSYLLSCKRLVERINKVIFGIFLIIVPLLSLMFALGVDRSLSESKINEPNANIYFVSSPNVPHKVIILRVLEKGLLSKIDKESTYTLHLWNDISRVDFQPRYTKPFRGILCDWFGVTCSIGAESKK